MSKNRYEIKITGIVQGVGFRPFIYKLAQDLNLKGLVKNSSAGVSIEIESTEEELANFVQTIPKKKPLQSQIETLNIQQLDYLGYQEFAIANSDLSSLHNTVLILPDLNICVECLSELFTPENRRYRYPFINCTNCGPRYSIIKDLPYDRISTTMKNFVMCAECEEEYNNPLNRRFHAQPNACEKCGPHLELWDKKGNCLAKFDQALRQTTNLIKTGKILAIKGLGGFHLVVDAGNQSAVQNLRLLKNRPDKPFALMYPNLEQIKRDCLLSKLAEKILLSPASPIVLLKRINLQNDQYICEEVAPKNPYLGVMLPYTPLHHLVLAELNFPIVATSGNLSHEPICIDESEALHRLNTIADYFLVHNRPIFHSVDDSIVRVINNQIMILRRARGYAPLPINLPGNKQQSSQKILALGGHLKNTIAIAFQQKVFLSQHLGNLDNPETLNSYEQTITNLSHIYNFQPDLIVCDAHPDYYSTNYGEKLSLNNSKKQEIPLIKVQHHLAHTFSTIAEHNVKFPLLSIAWDGSGYGLDHTIWGGEFFYITEDKIQRIASFLPFPLLGGNKAISQPKRITLALLHQLLGNVENVPQNLKIINSFSSQELNILTTMLEKKINSPLTSSVGRLFDGVSALLGIIDKVTFEGQAARQLEFTIDDLRTHESYPFHWQYNPHSCSYIDWQPIIKNIIKDYLSLQPLSLISAKFHLTLVKIIMTIAEKINIENVILTGGCFQNKYLLENAINYLYQAKFRPYWSQKVPLNDGGLVLGQAHFANSAIEKILY